MINNNIKSDTFAIDQKFIYKTVYYYAWINSEIRGFGFKNQVLRKLYSKLIIYDKQ